ncbi:MAG: c-type cytochrome [Gemmatimonadetes bacterium]|nr:c-type cytochrome [Gemmatimonadota bacterium]
MAPYLARVSWIAATLVVGAAGPGHTQQPHPGKAVYDKWCAGCHGVEGKGDGPAAAYMLPRPRDFTQALYQIRSTPSGALPLDSDIRRVIDQGMPGTAMPGWKDKLSKSQREALVAYLKTFSRFFQSEQAPQAMEFGRPPGVGEEALAQGRELFNKIECWKCHGRAGRGDGPSAPTQEDDNGFPIRPSDLTENWYFNGGGSAEEIYRRLRTGLDGTPMPSFTDLLESKFLTEEQLWRVAQYVRSLAPEKPPRVREVVRAQRREGPMPASPEDSAWANVERYYIPLVGQIMVRARWFSPTVDGVWVQALHNGRELALRLVWHDPSRSPDPEWFEWQDRLRVHMEPADGDTAAAGPLPDALAVQFPRSIPAPMAPRPHFLMGNARDPVYLWHWQSRPDTVVEALGRGLGRIEPLGTQQQAVTASATFDQAEWRLLLRRTLTTADSAGRLQFRTGETIPLALFAWDGSSGERGTRGAISSWYYLYLDPPASSTVYTAPLLATVLTAGLGLLVVARAQRREKQHRENT